MRSLKKVHWFHAEGSRKTLLANLNWFIEKNHGKDEISTTAYTNDMKLYSEWGSIGILLDGHTTLAANDMNAIYSGFISDFMKDVGDVNKYKSSGLPRRPGKFGAIDMFVQDWTDDYILDAESFKKSNRNEFIIDNWKVKAIVFGRRAKNYIPYANLKLIRNLATQYSIPIIDENGEPT